MATKTGLGRGLDALMANVEDEAPKAVALASGETKLSLDLIKANPNQPRRVFDETALRELADSIHEHGIIQPIVVEKKGNEYLIVAGERRSRAARIAGLKEVPVVIRDYSDERRLEVALVENVQREDLNPIEEASAYRQLMDLGDLSQEEVAIRVGKNRSTIANALRLLKLPEDIQGSLSSGQLTSGHARAILSVVNPADQRLLFDRIVDQGLSVREAEKLAGDLNNGSRAASSKPKAPEAKAKDPEIKAMEQKFIDALGTKVEISGGLKRGSITIDYFSMDDLDRIYSIIAEK